MTRFVVPRAPSGHPIAWLGVPQPFVGKVSAVVRTRREAQELVRFFGSPDYAPWLPVLLLIPAQEPIVIAGEGKATAARLRDFAVAAFEIILQDAEQAEGDGRFGFRELTADRSRMHAVIKRANLQKRLATKGNDVSAPPDLDYAPQQQRRPGRV